MTHRINPIVTALLVAVVSCLAQMSVQAQPGGGKLKPEPTPANKTTPKTTPKPSAKETPRNTGALDRIDGKWWTTGNGFGDSEVIFSQDGSRISGVIHWGDGRTGTINGNLVGKRLQHTWS